MVRKLLLATLALGFSSAHAVSITASDVANDLRDAIIGAGITTVGDATYIGSATQSGTFTGGAASGVGFDSGIVLTSGDVSQVPGPNDNDPETRGAGDATDDDVSTDLGRAGDADLDALSGFDTFDAAVLEFDFQFGDGSVGGDLFFNFVFASEEYIDFIDTMFNDVFGFFVDGVNIALVPGTADPITINTVNDVANSGFYRNNVDNTDGIANLNLDISFDGLTTVITAELLGLSAGMHSMKFAVADASDGILDAGVFIEAGSFTNENPSQGVPEPGTLTLLGVGLFGLGMLRRRKRV